MKRKTHLTIVHDGMQEVVRCNSFKQGTLLCLTYFGGRKTVFHKSINSTYLKMKYIRNFIQAHSLADAVSHSNENPDFRPASIFQLVNIPIDTLLENNFATVKLDSNGITAIGYPKIRLDKTEIYREDYRFGGRLPDDERTFLRRVLCREILNVKNKPVLLSRQRQIALSLSKSFNRNKLHTTIYRENQSTTL